MDLSSSWFTTSNLIRLLVVVASCGASEIFQLPPICPVLSDDGDALCAMDLPSLSFRSVSKVECSLKCISSRGICSAFDYMSSHQECHIFSNQPVNITKSRSSNSPDCVMHQPQESTESEIDFNLQNNCSFPFTFNGQLYYQCMPIVHDASNRCNKYACMRASTNHLSTCPPWLAGIVFRNLTVYIPVIASWNAATDTYPSIDDTTPEIDDTTSAINDTIPAINATILAIDDTILSINDTIPAINDTIPAINDTIPAINDTIPAINNTIPASLTHNDTITASNDTYPSSDQYFPVISVNNWIVWQQRIDSTTDFNVGWSHYRGGFGVYDKNYWMGLEQVHQMTFYGSCRLRFELLNDLNQWLSVEYDTFHLDSESLFYTIHLTGHSGDMISGDPMDSPASGGSWRHNGMPFSTLDSDQHFCAINYGGGWWWNSCHSICLNGRYDFLMWSVVPAFGYDDFYGDTSHYHQLEASRMMIKCN